MLDAIAATIRTRPGVAGDICLASEVAVPVGCAATLDVLAHGVRSLTADVLSHNAAMLKVFRRADHDTTVTMEAGVREVRMLFRQASPAE